MDETKTGHVFGKVDIKDQDMLFMICCIAASSPDVTLGPPVLVLQQVRPGGAVTPDHVTDDEEERD